MEEHSITENLEMKKGVCKKTFFENRNGFIFSSFWGM
jgi:hypothetical protein